MRFVKVKKGKWKERFGIVHGNAKGGFYFVQLGPDGPNAAIRIEHCDRIEKEEFDRAINER